MHRKLARLGSHSGASALRASRTAERDTLRSAFLGFAALARVTHVRHHSQLISNANSPPLGLAASHTVQTLGRAEDKPRSKRWRSAPAVEFAALARVTHVRRHSQLISNTNSPPLGLAASHTVQTLGQRGQRTLSLSSNPSSH